VFFWWPETRVEGLSEFRTRLMDKTGQEFRGCPCEYDPFLEMIPPSQIEAAMAALQKKVMVHLAEGEFWDDWSGAAF
jgi:hypothetical protein